MSLSDIAQIQQQFLLENKCHGLFAVFALKWQGSSQHFKLGTVIEASGFALASLFRDGTIIVYSALLHNISAY